MHSAAVSASTQAISSGNDGGGRGGGVEGGCVCVGKSHRYARYTHALNRPLTVDEALGGLLVGGHGLLVVLCGFSGRHRGWALRDTHTNKQTHTHTHTHTERVSQYNPQGFTLAPLAHCIR